MKNSEIELNDHKYVVVRYDDETIIQHTTTDITEFNKDSYPYNLNFSLGIVNPSDSDVLVILGVIKMAHEKALKEFEDKMKKMFGAFNK